MSLKTSLLILLGLSACTSEGPADGPLLDAAPAAQASELDASASGAGRGPGARPDEAETHASAVAGDAGALASMDAQRPAASDPTVSTPAAPHWDLCAQLALHAGVQLPAGPMVSWARLLCDTVDLARFTRAAQPAYTASMASSYDRASKHEGAAGWYANDDHGFYLRDQGDEHVMMEAHGPGVITRLWSPNPTGLIRIYIDDPDRPAIELPMIDLLSGKFRAPWGEPFVSVAAEGYSALFPIPHASYARVSTTSNEQSLYYQVEHRSYPADTQVEPFSVAALSSLVPLARALSEFLAAPSSLPALTALPVHELVLSAAAPEQSAQLGPVVVRELVVRGFDARDLRLRTTRLILTVDGERTVDAPLGDLFGTGPGLAPHESLAASVTHDALTLRWPIPVRAKLTARVESSAGPLDTLTVALRYSAGVDDAQHQFHARWTGPHSFSSDVAAEWSLLDQRGAGWYVGTVLNVGNPTNLWWGEGDEKVFVDGETFPSHFGTGTEDYFSYGWCSNELFSRPWFGQTRADGPANAGRSSMYRWHIADAIPFTTQLRFRLEVVHWFKDLYPLTLTEDAVTYWYGSAAAPSEHKLLDSSAFVVPPLEDLSSPALDHPTRCRI